LAWVSPADSFGTAIGIGINVGIGIGVGIELTNPLSAKLLADRLATLSERREHGHKTIEQCLLLAVVVGGQRIAHQRARPHSPGTPGRAAWSADDHSKHTALLDRSVAMLTTLGQRG
jgi:hypothetical protein